MDVVRANIERVGGSIQVSSTPGQGTRIMLSLPLTLSIIPSLTVQSGGQLFAMPRSYVDEIVHGRAGHIEFARAGDAVLVTVRGQRIACLSLAAMLGGTEKFVPEASTLVLIRLAGGDLFALACDRILDHEELVIKPLAPAIMATGLYAGSTLLDDGNPVLMLDVAGIARKARLIGDVQGRVRSGGDDDSREAERKGTPAMLFIGLDGRRKAVRLSLVRRIERIAASSIDLGGERPQAVIGEAIFALAGADAGPLPADQASVLRLGDGTHEIAYVFDTIVDTVDLPEDIVPAPRGGPVEGTVLIGGEPADLLDAHWLFAAFASPVRAARRPLCRLPAGDPWAQSILAPLIENAGYAIVDENFSGEADVAIATDEARPDTLAGGTVITLSADPDSAAQGGDKLYRYDRAGLLARLTALRAGRAA